MRRIGGYRQNFQLEWPSVWLSDWAEIWCGKVSRLEEHTHNISRDLHEWLGSCFRPGGVSGACRARIMGFGTMWHCRRGTLWDTRRLACAFLAKFGMVGAGVQWGTPTKFGADRRCFGGWSGVSKKMWRIGGYRKNFQLEWPSMWLSDWAKIWCGKVSRLKEHVCKISRNLHERFGRCLRIGGLSGACRERIVGVWRVVTLLEGTSLGHKETGLCVFSEIWYGGSWGRMRSAHKISS